MRTALLALTLLACTDTTTPEDTNEGELITTVELTFTPVAGGDDITATWADAGGDGNPEIDAITLVEGEAYDLGIRFLDELSDPAEDITAEVADEAEEHQVFITGDAVDSPATDNTDAPITVVYADTDANGLPIGLEHAVTASTAGTGELTVTLRHLPAEGDTPVKVDGLAEDVASGGFASIAGDTDAQVTFDLTVSATR